MDLFKYSSLVTIFVKLHSVMLRVEMAYIGNMYQTSISGWVFEIRLCFGDIGS